MHASTVGYWARKHGLRPPHSARFAQRGAPDRQLLTELAASGATLRQMAEAVDRSVATVRHWLGRWEIERPIRRKADPATAPSSVQRHCARHGLVTFRLEGRGYYRCTACRQLHVANWRRRLKAKLVAEAGGRCALCGYSRCHAALQFHHLDPGQKAFSVSHQGVTRSLERARAEAAKCALLCSNCHAEVEVGYATLSDAGRLMPGLQKSSPGWIRTTKA